MALDDLIATYGGRTANYLDLHGDSAIEDVHEGLALLEFDNRVKCIVINLFCGQFEIIPFVKALVSQRQMDIQTKPIVLRIKGALMEEALTMLHEELDLEVAKGKKKNIHFCDQMDEAARKAVKIAVDEHQIELELLEQRLEAEK